MKRLPILLLVLLTSYCLQAQKPGRLKDCDLVFQLTENANAITEATSHGSLPIDHVGIFCHHDGQPVVIEATYCGVVITPLSVFMQSPERIIIGRVRGKIDKPQTIANALRYVGRPYDFLFQEGDGEIYCSELVQLCYVNRNGQQVFDTIGMSFHDADGKILPYWEDYYSRRGMPLPEGKPGTNPSELSQRKNVKLLKKR